MANKTAATLVHERHGSKHRIVRIQGTTVEQGKWVESNELATLDRLVANISTDEALPTGIFTINAAAHQGLN